MDSDSRIRLAVLCVWCCWFEGMNHHIRKALQVITYATASKSERGSVELVRSSVERIEWALRDVLPGHVTASEFFIQRKGQERTITQN